MNVVKITKKGYSKEEATQDLPFNLLKDATSAWKKAGMPVERELDEFIEKYLTKTTKMTPGNGCAITLTSGKDSDRKRPYKFTNVVNEKGKRKYKTGLKIVNRETGEDYGTIFGTKQECQAKIREMYSDEDFRGNLIVSYVKEVVEGEDIAFTVDYAPSKSATIGSWLCFGVPTKY